MVTGELRNFKCSVCGKSPSFMANDGKYYCGLKCIKKQINYEIDDIFKQTSLNEKEIEEK